MNSPQISAVSIDLNLYGTGKSHPHSSVPFLDHMFDAFSRHGYFDLTVEAIKGPASGGSKRVNALGTELGHRILEALGNRRGIRGRGSFLLPMDETLSIVSLDLKAKPSLRYNVSWIEHSKLGALDGKLLKGFFESVVKAGKFHLDIELRYGKQPHHVAESIFKGFAKALSQAIERT